MDKKEATTIIEGMGCTDIEFENISEDNYYVSATTHDGKDIIGSGCNLNQAVEDFIENVECEDLDNA